MRQEVNAKQLTYGVAKRDLLAMVRLPVRSRFGFHFLA